MSYRRLAGRRIIIAGACFAWMVVKVLPALALRYYTEITMALEQGRQIIRESNVKNLILFVHNRRRK